ncbi:unnamed protein product [Sphacelaria rigidula]
MDATVDSDLRKIGFTATASDPCVYTRGQNSKYVTFTLFVNGILLTGPSIKLLQDVQDTPKKEVSISELGPVSLNLGMERTDMQSRGGGGGRGTLKLCQHKYVISLLQTLNVESCNSVHTPGITNSTLPATAEHLPDFQAIK